MELSSQRCRLHKLMIQLGVRNKLKSDIMENWMNGSFCLGFGRSKRNKVQINLNYRFFWKTNIRLFHDRRESNITQHFSPFVLELHCIALQTFFSHRLALCWWDRFHIFNELQLSSNDFSPLSGRHLGKVFLSLIINLFHLHFWLLCLPKHDEVGPLDQSSLRSVVRQGASYSNEINAIISPKIKLAILQLYFTASHFIVISSEINLEILCINSQKVPPVRISQNLH